MDIKGIKVCDMCRKDVPYLFSEKKGWQQTIKATCPHCGAVLTLKLIVNVSTLETRRKVSK